MLDRSKDRHMFKEDILVLEKTLGLCEDDEKEVQLEASTAELKRLEDEYWALTTRPGNRIKMCRLGLSLELLSSTGATRSEISGNG